MKKIHFISVLMLVVASSAHAGVRTPGEGGGSSQMVARLQAMVRQVTKERDALKVENAKMSQQLAALNKDKTALQAENSKVSKKLAGTQSSHRKLMHRQQSTMERLSEVIEKYKALNVQKNQLHVELKSMNAQYDHSSEQLGMCTQHNEKLISAANELLERYQHKGTFSGLLQSEGVLQFESVEMENIVQAYEDRIRDEKYQETAQLDQ